MNAAEINVVIVTYNHGATISRTLESVLAQSRPAGKIVVVDCASDNVTWMDTWQSRPRVELVRLERNLGFCGGNNIGWRMVEGAEIVVFLNPDVIVPPDVFEKLAAIFTGPGAERVAAVSPQLLGYDFAKDAPTGTVDSTGIFPLWYGGWADRRVPIAPSVKIQETVPALCGAFMFCRSEALRAVLRPGDAVFDERYFAYKEDIELSLRLRRVGLRLEIAHHVHAFHGRGWGRERMAHSLRLRSARNELRLHATYAPWRLPYSLAKWMWVKGIER